MISSRMKQSGFIMIQVLLGLVVLIALMTGWAYYQNREHQKAVANRITNEINYILEAATSYYIHEGNQWPQDISVLITKGYLEQKPNFPVGEVLNPYGNQYVVEPSSMPGGTQKNLILKTEIPHQYVYVARTAMGALPFAEFQSKGNLLKVTLNPPPGNSKVVLTDKRVVSPGTSEAIIEKPDCSEGQKPAIYTSIASCGDATGNSIGACRAYAVNTKDGKDKAAWQVKLQVLTEGGWIDGEESPLSQDLNKVEVSTACQVPDIK